MENTAAETTRTAADPRVRRTRQLLQEALQKLLKTKPLDRISIQEIADSATVNRVTFYDHYPDKFALFECSVASRFEELIAERGIKFDCSSALTAIALAVCDYLSGITGPEADAQRRMDPHLESAIIAVVRRMLLEGMQKHPPADGSAPVTMTATAVSWAIYGAAQEWVREPWRPSSEDAAKKIVALVSPMLASNG